MKRRVGVAGLVALALLAILLWKWRSGDVASTKATSAAKVVATTPGQLGAKPHVDPRTLERASIGGTISDEDHAPVPRARVCVDAESNDLPGELTRDPHCTNADDHGHYMIGDLFAAEYSASAMAKPFRPAIYHPDGNHKQTAFTLHAGEHRTDIDLVLRKGGVEITGTVSDLTGGPIARAMVRPQTGWWSNEGSYPAVETDEQGKFSMWIKPGDVEVTATADGYANGSDNGKAPGKFELLLTPESSLAGTVVDAKTNEPVAGVPVRVAAGGWFGWGGEGTGDITDEKGHFHASRLAPERYVVSARSANGFGRSDGSTLVGLGQHVDGVIVKLFPAIRIAGRVVIPDAKQTTCKLSSLGLHDVEHDRWLSGKREPDGTLHADGVLPGTYEVRAECDGYKSRDKYPKLEVKDKDLIGLEWEVEIGAIVRGKVLTKSGSPVEDASVWARTSGGAARDKTAWGGDSSKKDGTYVLDGLKAGGYKIEISTDRGVGPKDGWKVDVTSGTTVEKDLILEDSGTITGTVADAEGKPIGGVQISARSSSGVFGWGGNEVRSSDDGTFKIEGVRAGDYRVLAHRGWWNDDLRKPGSNDDAKQGEKVTVRESQTVNVRLVVESQSGTIKGTVTDPDGKPVSDAFIGAARESDAAGNQRSSVGETRWSADERPVLTSTDGTFTVTKLSPGKYTLRAYRKGGGEAIAEHIPIGGTAKLQIKPTGSIEGTAHRAGGGGAPIEISVQLSDPKTSFWRTEHFFRTAGAYTIHDLPVGHFTITVTAEHGQKQTTVDLAEGEHKTGVDIELDVLLTLSGRVVELVSGQPVPKMMMVASLGKAGAAFAFGGDGDDQENVSDEAGHFLIKNAPRGVLTIRGFPKDWGDSDYGFLAAVRNADGVGTVDIGDLKVAKRRTKKNEPVGEIGIHFAKQPEGTDVDKHEFKVSWIDPAGPAAKTELKVGDVVTSVDGIDCTGASYENGWMLIQAPPGTALKLGVARGATVTVVLAAP